MNKGLLLAIVVLASFGSGIGIGMTISKKHGYVACNDDGTITVNNIWWERTIVNARDARNKSADDVILENARRFHAVICGNDA
jgi:hypothetical protein